MRVNAVKLFVPRHQHCELVTSDSQLPESFEAHNAANSEVDFVSSPQTAEIIVLFQVCSFKTTDYADELACSDLLRRHAEKIIVINYDDVVGMGFLPGCYTSLRNKFYDERFFQPCAYPKTYNEVLSHTSEQEKAWTGSEVLYSFMGTRHSHPCRADVIDLLQGQKNSEVVEVTKPFHSHSTSDKDIYRLNMLGSKFVLCPRGWSPSTYRVYEAMSIGRCPVIISDDWVAPIGPDWDSFSIRVSEDQIAHIPELLFERINQAEEMGSKAYAEWTQHFTTAKKNQAYLRSVLHIHRHTPKRSFETYQSYWRSKQFLEANGWSLKQKLLRRARRLFP